MTATGNVTLEDSSDDGPDSPKSVQVWMVERTVSSDSPHILVIRYATEEGTAYVQQERAVPTSAAYPEVTAAIDVSPDRLSPVEDEETREWYADEAERMREMHDPDDVV